MDPRPRAGNYSLASQNFECGECPRSLNSPNSKVFAIAANGSNAGRSCSIGIEGQIIGYNSFDDGHDVSAGEWWVPVTAEVGNLVEFGQIPVQIMGSVTYWADSPEDGLDGFAFRMDVLVVLPKVFKK